MEELFKILGRPDEAARMFLTACCALPQVLFSAITDWSTIMLKQGSRYLSEISETPRNLLLFMEYSKGPWAEYIDKERGTSHTVNISSSLMSPFGLLPGDKFHPPFFWSKDDPVTIALGTKMSYAHNALDLIYQEEGTGRILPTALLIKPYIKIE